MAALQDILGWRNISTSVQKVESGIPDLLPAELKTLKENVLGDRTTYITFRGQRQTARRGEYGAPSRARVHRPVGEQSVALLHFPEHYKVEQELLMRLRQPNDLLAQQKAQELIARQGADFRTLFDNTRILAITMALANGKIWFDSSGNILPTSSGAAVTIDYGVPANNLNQLNGIIGTKWSTTSAPIITDLEEIAIQNRRNTGRTPKHAFYGLNIPRYLFLNDTLKQYWQYNPEMYKALAAEPGRVPQGFAGLMWHPMGQSFFDDQNETTQACWGNDLLVFTPEITRNVYTLFEGSLPVPKTFGVYTDAMAAINDVEIIYGMGGYAILVADPLGVKVINFDTFLPMFKTANVGDIFIATVDF